MTDPAWSASAAAVSDPEDAPVPPPPWARMAIAVLALVGVLIAGYLLLYHLGFIGRLLCGPGDPCERVQTSPYATFLGMPVPAIGLAGYVVILGIVLAGVRPSWAGERRISLALAALSLVAVLFTGYLNALEAYVIHAWCRWCIASAVVIVLIFLFSLADLATLGGRRRAAASAPSRPEEP